jgi:SAM-dependent methyltransferase
VHGAFHDFEQRGWQRAAAFYPTTFGDLTALAAEPLLDAARVGAGTRTLDVATGPGYVAAAAAARGARVVGIDFSPAMIEEAKRRFPDIEFRIGDAESLDGTYEAVVASFCLLHLERPEVAIAEAHRVLEPGGRYAFTVWDATARGFAIVMDALKTHGRIDVGLPDGPPFFRYSDHEECRRALAGFSAVEVSTRPLVWRFSDPEMLFRAALDGGVRTSAIMQAQTPEALAKVRAAIRDGLEAHRDGDAFALPMPYVLASGVC